MCDTGASVNLICFQLIENYGLIQSVEPTTETLIGIQSKPVPAEGKILLDITIGDSYFPRVEFLLLSGLPVQAIIGLKLFRERLSKLHLDFRADCARFESTDGQNRILGTASFALPAKLRHGDELNLSLPEKISFLKRELAIDMEGCNVGTPDEHAKMVDLLFRYRDAFASKDEKIGLFPVEQRIPTAEGKAINQPQFPVPEKYRAIVDKEIQSMLIDGVIEDCPDPQGWNSPVFIVDKADGSPRFIVNFKRTLNLALVDEDTFVMPNAEEMLNSIGVGSKFFGAFDFKSGYWQIGLDSRDRHKTSFCWKGRNYQFTRIPFGLKTSGNIFGRAISIALKDVSQLPDVEVYVDDVFVHSATFSDYYRAVEGILIGSVRNNARMSGKKCKILRSDAVFLGRKVTSTGFEPLPEYVQGIAELPVPTKKVELQRLIGRLVWVRSHLGPRTGEKVAENSFAHLIKPLTALLKGKRFEWTEAADAAFRRAKERLSSTPIFRFADFDRQFIMVTDASQVACGAVLMQIDRNGSPYICASVSKTFTQVEARWSTIERECYGIVFGLQKFEFFLKGREFIIKTDHRPLVYIDTVDFRNPKVERWSHILSHFRFVVQYIPGVENNLADLLSRPSGVPNPPRADPKGRLPAAGQFLKMDDMLIYKPSWMRKDVKPVKVDVDEAIPEVRTILSVSIQKPFDDEPLLDETDVMARYQQDDPLINSIIRHKLGLDKARPKLDLKNPEQRFLSSKFNHLEVHPVSNLLVVKFQGHYKVFVPQAVRPALVFRAHNGHTHIGTPKVLDLLLNYTWPDMTDDVTNFVQSCEFCRLRKGSAGNQNPPMRHLARPSAPWQVCYMDFICFPEQSKGFKYALTYMCGFSRFLITVPLRHERASDCARALISRVFLPFSPPDELSCDRGSAFRSELIGELCKQWGVDLKFHCAWRPQSTGVLERVHRILKDCIFITCRERGIGWADALPLVTKAINVSKCKAIGVSPYEAIFGHRNRLGKIPGHLRNSCDSANTHSVIVSLNLEAVHKTVQAYQASTDESLDRRKSKTEAEELIVGQEVYLKRPRSAAAKESHFRSVGPYTVVATNDSVVHLTDASGVRDFVHRSDCHPKTQRKPLFDQFPNLTAPPPTLLEVEKPAVYNPAGTELVPTPSIEKEPERSSNDPPNRRSSRSRRPTKAFNIGSTKGKSYS